ncbi:Aste57867_25099 [Aphanomyces stellatus]|uniref:Aste57867_25099 protein n=1 Tax=Aphanomyces stellatus TaxID=120398 RepID=A0A485LWQ5_9STRA|nr:hypothetical protein As57867_025021 [Aphanomyces stellatus]VFU01730.1 Aste57867_25099 [Aphanomyces stellatus]
MPPPAPPPSRSVVWRSTLHLYTVGLTVVLGGQYFSWNAGLAAGSLAFLISIFLMGVGYFCLCCCLAEISSMVPFTTSAFGLARWTCGFYLGFLVGCCEVLQNILYVACAVVQLARLVTQLLPSTAPYRAAVWLVCYVAGSTLLAGGGRVYWRWNVILASVSLGLLVVYVGGSIPLLVASFPPLTPPTSDDVAACVHAFPLAASFFVGIEALNHHAPHVAAPAIVIPRAQLACMATLLVTALGVFFASLVHATADLPTALSPLAAGFQHIFQASDAVATALSIPATFATAQGFAQSYTHSLVALAHSRLLPPRLAVPHATFHTHVAAIAVGSALSFAVCFAADSASTVLFNVSLLCACVAYASQCAGFIALRRDHRELDRPFRSPVGVPGAAVSLLVWAGTAVALVAFQDDCYVAAGVTVASLALASLYYVAYAKRRQGFSPDELRSLLFAHVAALNARHRRRARRHSIDHVPTFLLQYFLPKAAPTKYKKSLPAIYRKGHKVRHVNCAVTVSIGRSVGRASIGRAADAIVAPNLPT